MRRYFYPFIFLACILLALAPAAAFACPKHHNTPCKPPQSRPLPPAAISVRVVETFSTIVYDYDFEWEWDCREKVWVKRWFVVGWHTEWKTEERWVTAYWNDALGTFTYLDKNGQTQVVHR
jgi:hypothetical protein